MLALISCILLASIALLIAAIFAFFALRDVHWTSATVLAYGVICIVTFLVSIGTTLAICALIKEQSTLSIICASCYAASFGIYGIYLYRRRARSKYWSKRKGRKIETLLCEQNLFAAIDNKENERVKLYLLQNDIEMKDRLGRTALLHAAWFNNADLITWLFQWHANVNARDLLGMTAWHLASWNGHLECVRLLLACRVDVNQLDNDGNTAAHLAAIGLNPDTRLPILEELHRRGADFSLRNHTGQSVLEKLPPGVAVKFITSGEA